MDIIPIKKDNLLSKNDIDSLISEWLEYQEKVEDASQNTIKAYARSFRIFLDWLTVGLELVTPVDIGRFKAEFREKYSVQTVNLHLTAVRSFYRFCVNQGYTRVNPAREVKSAKRIKSNYHKRDTLTDIEIKSLLNQPDINTLAGLRDKAILTLMLFCALRTIEIHRVDIEDVRTRDNRLTLDIKGKGQGDKTEYVVIPVNQEYVIREYLKERMKLDKTGALFISVSNRSKTNRIALSSLRNLIKEYFNLAGVIGDKKTSHSLRHSAISNAIRNGASVMQVQNLGRHTDFNTTLIYIHEVKRIDNPPEDFISYE